MDAAILRALEHIRCPFFDFFFSVFTALGEEMIIAAVIALIYVSFSKRLGEQALVTVLSASCITAAVKSAVRRTRPYAAGDVTRVDIDNPFVSTVDLDADMSVPSGHATAPSGFFGTVALRARRLLPSLLCAAFVLLVMLSRLYFGVHYPTDVLTGLLIGAGCAALWQWIYARWCGARLYVYLGIALCTLPFLFFERTGTESMFEISALTLATAAGLLVEDKFIRFEDAKKWLHRLLRPALTVAVAAVPFLPLHFLLPEGNWYTFLTLFAALFAALTAAPWLFKKLKI